MQQIQSVFKSHNIQLCGFPHLLCEFVVSRQRVCGRVITIYKSITLDWEPEALCSTTLEGASWGQRLSLPLLLCNLPDEERRSLEVCESLPIESSWSHICTFINCDMEDHQFEGHNDWYEHELQNHRIEWCCHLDGHSPCTSPSEFLLHLQEHHPDLQSSSLSQDIIRQFQRPAQKDLKNCPLCSKPSEKLKSHLSRHIEQMAFIVCLGRK